MRRLRAALLRLIAPLTRARREHELAEELESHLQLHVDDNIRSGMTPVEARRAALVKLGGVEAVREACRDRAGFAPLGRLAQDLRFALRLLRKAPGFAIVTIATIALAVGVNAAIFTIFNAAVLQPLPVPGGDRLAAIAMRWDGPGRRGVAGMPSMLSYPEFLAVRDQAAAFDGVLAFSSFQQVTMGGTEPRSILATLASCEYFDVLRIRASLGRTFTPADCAAGAAPTVVLSDGLWRSAFSSNPAIVGRTIELNRRTFAVIGVAAPGFTGTQAVAEDAFVPVMFQHTIAPDLNLFDNADTSWLAVMGRLRDGASLRSARASLGVVAARLTAVATPGRRLYLDAAPATLSGAPEVRTLVLAVGGVLVAAVTLVLLMACANIANLLLARGATRRNEMAVRLALGAGRGRLVQQLLTESFLFAAIGGTVGCLAGAWTSAALVGFLLAHLPPGMWPMVFTPHPDSRVLVYGLVITTMTGAAFGLVPALQTARGQSLDIRAVGATDRPALGRLRQTLVALQVAVSVVMVVAAGLLLRGLHRALTLDPGIAMQDVAVLSYDLRGAGYAPSAAAAFQRQAEERLRALPGVRGVAEAGGTPLSDQHTETQFSLPGSKRDLFLEFSQVGRGYFDLLGLPIVRGRTFSPAEVESERALVITESTARRLWPERDPLTQSLVLDGVDRPVVGVLRDAQLSRLGRTDSSYVFLPAGPGAQPSMRMLVAAPGGIPGIRVLRDALRALDPQLVVDIAPLTVNLEIWRAPSRLVSSMAAALGVLALVLACTGVFGTVAYAVTRRVREIGIRVALGAAHDEVLRLIVRQGMRPVVIGILVGLPAAAAASTLLGSLLFGVSPLDPVSFVLVPSALFLIALLACYLPARRATRVDPAEVLRA